VSINYRFVPQYSLKEQIGDCYDGLKWTMGHIQNYGGDPSRIAVTGHSLGGYMAALLVVGKKWHRKYDIDIGKIRCWFPMSGFYDLSLKENRLSPCLAPLMGPILKSAKDDASPVEQVTGSEPPSLIIHGGDDWCVPKTNAFAFFRRLREKGSRSQLAIIKHYMHANVFTDYYKPKSKH
jgi:acetyl esterase/lipase